MNVLDAEDEDATPLTPDEREGLIPTHVALRHEVNELEQTNILEADLWAFQRQRPVLDEAFLRRLHKRMFGNVWKWAGAYRTTPRNLGVEPWRIPIEMRLLLDDAHVWIDAKTYPPDELAVRFHHRLVSTHPFPNGNGRWSRLAADLLIVTLGEKRLTWGRDNLQTAGTIRRRYMDALHAADTHDLDPLIVFARS